MIALSVPRPSPCEPPTCGDRDLEKFLLHIRSHCESLRLPCLPASLRCSLSCPLPYLSVRSISLKAASDMKVFPITIVVAIYTVFACAIETSLSSARISDRDISDRSPKLTSRGINGLHPTVAFWDDNHAADEDWSKYVAKGGALMCGLEGSDETAGRQMKDIREPPSAARPYNGDLKIELQNWYWRETNPSSFSCSFSEHWHLSYAMRSLGLDGRPTSQGGDNHCHRIEHWDPENKNDKGDRIPAINQWYSVPGNSKQYRVSLHSHTQDQLSLTVDQATKAHFEFGINTKGGAIYGLFLEGPQASAKAIWGGGTKEPNKDDLPQLRAFSDIIWGYWVRNNPNVKNIRYFFMLGISNDLTNQIIASCLRDANAQLSEWPGTDFSTATDQGHALLGKSLLMPTIYFQRLT
jgi:hypothetical protein